MKVIKKPAQVGVSSKVKALFKNTASSKSNRTMTGKIGEAGVHPSLKKSNAKKP